MTAERVDLPKSDAVLDGAGLPLTCANLTPMMKERIRELQSGQVLEVLADDPVAREGVPAWSRLTGNELLAMHELDANRTRFYVRKK